MAIAEDGTFKSSFAKFMKEDEMNALIAAMADSREICYCLLLTGIRWYMTYSVTCVLELARQLDLLKKNDFKFLWVTEFPLLEYSEEEDRYVAMHHPFTMPMDEDLQYIDTDPGRVRAKAYDIVLNGVELGGVPYVSTRRISSPRCLKYWDFHRNAHRSSSASCKRI